jgi:effector-binding domain-containing protein
MKINYVLVAAIFIFSIIAFSEEIVIKDQTPFTYAYLECSGSYTQIPAKIGEFMGAFFKQGLTPSGALLGQYFNSPGEVDEADLKWAIGMPVVKDAAVKEPLKRGEFKQTVIAYYLYKGPYEKIGTAYDILFKQITEKGYAPAGPTMENYLDDPYTTKPEEIRTEIIVPVVKK